MTAYRMIYLDASGKPAYASARAITPAEFDEVLLQLAHDLNLALECRELFGGVPIPVATAVLENLEPVRAALDLALRVAAGKAVA